MFRVHHHSPQSSSFFHEFRRLNLNLYEFLSKFLIFQYSILTIYIYNQNNENSSIICCCVSLMTYTSLFVFLLVVKMFHLFVQPIYLDPPEQSFKAAFVILSSNLFRRKPRVASTFLFYHPFQNDVDILSVSIADVFVLSRSLSILTAQTFNHVFHK